MAMRIAVQTLHASLTEQGGHDSSRHRAMTLELGLVVKQRAGLAPVDAYGCLAEQPGTEDIRAQELTARLNEGVAFMH